MTRFFSSIAIAALLSFHCGLAAGGEEELPADIVTGLLPLASYAIAHFKDDEEGEKQLLRTNVASLVVTTTLRVAFNQTRWGERPNGSSYGFPSGHAAFAMSSASFLQDRYGWKYGVPAYALAGYVSYVRVDTDHHRWRDVITGAAISYGITKLFVTPQNATHLAPIIGPEFIGLRWERSY